MQNMSDKFLEFVKFRNDMFNTFMTKSNLRQTAYECFKLFKSPKEAKHSIKPENRK